MEVPDSSLTQKKSHGSADGQHPFLFRPQLGDEPLDIPIERFLSFYSLCKGEAGSIGNRKRYLWETESATVGQVQVYLHKSPDITSALIAQLEETCSLTQTRSQEGDRFGIVELTPAGV